MQALMAHADHEGRFRGATQLKGIKDFAAKDYGLVPIQLDTWGQFVFIRADPSRCVCSQEAGGAGRPQKSPWLPSCCHRRASTNI